jgi:hypothetical protein
MGSRLRLGAAASVLVAGGAVIAPQEAGATIYPSNCVADARSLEPTAPFNPIPWQDYCWVGPSWSSNSTYVTAVQSEIKGEGYFSGCLDGVYGSATATGISNFQSSRGLTPDGLVGNQTWSKLEDGLKYKRLGADGPIYTASWDTTSERFLDNYNSSPESWYVKSSACSPGGVMWKNMHA